MSGKDRGRSDEGKTNLLAISKTLSWLLRHGATEAGLRMRRDGYALLEDVLKYPKLCGVAVQTVEEIVRSSDKQRFSLTVDEDSGETFIRANQGHTMAEVDDDALLTEICDAADVPVCIHGTYRRCIEPIMCTGLSRMARNHIHCAALLPKEGVVSGMRGTCQIAVYIDVAKTMALGLKWYRSDNGVLLTRGDRTGRVPPSCFEKVIDMVTGETVSVPSPIDRANDHALPDEVARLQNPAAADQAGAVNRVLSNTALPFLHLFGMHWQAHSQPYVQNQNHKDGPSSLEMPSLSKAAAFKRSAATLDFSEWEAIQAKKASGPGSRQGYVLPHARGSPSNTRATATCAYCISRS